MQKIKIILEFIPAEDVSPLQVRDALKGMGFRYDGIHHQPVGDERYSISFYKFIGKVDRNTVSPDLESQMVYKKEINRRIKELADELRIIF